MTDQWRRRIIMSGKTIIVPFTGGSPVIATKAENDE
jgi:hypothetical protein